MRFARSALLLVIICATPACDSTDPNTSESEIAEIRIDPTSATIPVGETMDFTFVALTASGDTVRDANLDVNWWSTDTTVFTVQPGGLAFAHEAGTAFCMVEAAEAAKASLRFTGRDSATVTVLF